jgi:hypothetical protein
VPEAGCSMPTLACLLPEQGTQSPSPAPDLITAETKNQPRTHIVFGTADGGTSVLLIRIAFHGVFLSKRGRLCCVLAETGNPSTALSFYSTIRNVKTLP